MKHLADKLINYSPVAMGIGVMILFSASFISSFTDNELLVMILMGSGIVLFASSIVSLIIGIKLSPKPDGIFPSGDEFNEEIKN